MGRVHLLQRTLLYVRTCAAYDPLLRSGFAPQLQAGQQGSAPWMGGVRHIRQHAKQKVILTSPMETLGQAGQIVKVAPGYARNRLIPNMLALPAIEKFVLLVQTQIQQVGATHVEAKVETIKTAEETEEENLKVVEAVLQRLAKGRVVLRRDVGMKTTLLKLVTKSDILNESGVWLVTPMLDEGDVYNLVSDSREVRKQLGVDLHEANLVMESDFSQLGDFDVLLRLPDGLKLPGDKSRMFLKIRIRRK